MVVRNVLKSELLKKLQNIIDNNNLLDKDNIQIIVDDKEIIIRPQVKKHSIMELRGLGKNLWKNIDEKKFIYDERNSWD